MRKIRFLASLVFLLISTLLSTSLVYSESGCPIDDPCKDISDVYKKINCYSSVVNTCSSQRESMTSQIIYLTTKIELTNVRIQSTKEKINRLEEDMDRLSERIGSLESSLTKITGILIDRIRIAYKYGTISYLNLLFVSRRFSDMMNRYKYIQTVQNHDRKLLFQLQNSKVNFEEQKQLREEKKKELDLAKKQLEKEEEVLAIQKKEKEVFLEVTKNSEKIYKQNLAAAQREAREIQKAASILSQAGVSKHVNRGDTIGVMGSTGFSTGPHLHFAVYDLKESELDKFNFNERYENPFDYLSSRQLSFLANSCDGISNRQTKTIGNGSWSWPMSNPLITQCFGHTPFSSAYYRFGIHNGLDMYDDSNPLVKAADGGNAYTYRGGQSAGNGVFIFHDNGKMTLYWHLQ